MKLCQSFDLGIGEAICTIVNHMKIFRQRFYALCMATDDVLFTWRILYVWSVAFFNHAASVFASFILATAISYPGQSKEVVE